MNVEHWWNDNDREIMKYSENISPSTTLSSVFSKYSQTQQFYCKAVLLYMAPQQHRIKQGTFYLPLCVVAAELCKAVLLYIFSLQQSKKQGTLYVAVEEVRKAVLLYILSLQQSIKQGNLYVAVEEICKAVLLYTFSLQQSIKQGTFYLPLYVAVKALPDIGQHN